MQKTVNANGITRMMWSIRNAARSAKRRRRSPAPRYSIHVPGFGLVGYYEDLNAVIDSLRYLPVKAYVCDADGVRLEM